MMQVLRTIFRSHLFFHLPKIFVYCLYISYISYIYYFLYFINSLDVIIIENAFFLEIRRIIFGKEIVCQSELGRYITRAEDDVINETCRFYKSRLFFLSFRRLKRILVGTNVVKSLFFGIIQFC